MKKLMLALVMVSLIFSLCACSTPVKPLTFTDIGPRGNLAPCTLEYTPEYVLQYGDTTVHVKFPKHKGLDGSIIISNDNKVTFEGVIGETFSPDEYQGLMEKTGWITNSELTNLKITENMPTLRVFALMLEANHELQAKYLAGRFGSVWKDIGLPVKSLAD